MRVSTQVFWSVALVLIAIVTGAAIGAALGWLDVLFLTGRVSFVQTTDYQSPLRLLARYLPVMINGLGGFLIGVLTSIALIRSTPPRPGKGGGFAAAFQGFILGGIAGALLGYVDLAVLAQYLNLASSDNASAWRENRGFLVMINAAFGSGVGLLLGIAARWRR